MNIAEANNRYRIRQKSIETLIGDIRENKGIQSLLTRAIATIIPEFDLICAACYVERIRGFASERNPQKQVTPANPIQPRLHFSDFYQICKFLFLNS